MIVHRMASVAGAAALAFAPLTSNAQLLFVPACGGETHLLVVPGDPGAPGPRDRGDCAKACHAATERRAKTAAGSKGCCP